MKLILFILSLLFVSCEKNNEKSKADENLYIALLARASQQNNCSAPGEFWARDLTSSIGRSYCVSSSLVAESNSIKLYLENGLVTAMDYSKVVSEFENQIKPKSDLAFGEASDINRDGKITVLILDIRDGARQGSGFVAGFVDPIDFYRDMPSGVTRSNEMEILYMDGKELEALRIKELSQGLPDTFLSTLAHEYQHLIRFQYSEGNDPTWIDEGTSEVASDITGYGPQTARMECYRGDSKTSCSNGILGESLISWKSSLKDYAFSYAFMSYLYSISGSTDEERGAFFRKTLAGTNMNNTLVRADKAENLIRVFSESSTFQKDILTDRVETAFQYIYAGFLAQSVGYKDISESYLGSKTATNLNSVLNRYPLPPHLEALYTPQPFPRVSPTTTFSLSSTQLYRVSGSSADYSFEENSHYVIIAKGTDEYIIFNSRFSDTGVTFSQLSNLDSPLDYPEMNLPDVSVKICPISYLKTTHEIYKKKYSPRLLIR